MFQSSLPPSFEEDFTALSHHDSFKSYIHGAFSGTHCYVVLKKGSVQIMPGTFNCVIWTPGKDELVNLLYIHLTLLIMSQCHFGNLSLRGILLTNALFHLLVGKNALSSFALLIYDMCGMVVLC